MPLAELDVGRDARLPTPVLRPQIGLPEACREIDAVRLEERHLLVGEESSHDIWVAPVPTSAQKPVAVDHPMTGKPGFDRGDTERPADRARRAGGAKSAGDRAIGGDAAAGNMRYDVIHTFEEGRPAGAGPRGIPA